MGAVIALALGGCNAEAPEVGQSKEDAYGAAAAQASAPRGNPGSDMQSLQQNREQDGQVIQDAQNALKALGR